MSALRRALRPILSSPCGRELSRIRSFVIPFRRHSYRSSYRADQAWLAGYFFGHGDESGKKAGASRLIRLDMSEYGGFDAVYRLLGPPRGEPGRLLLHDAGLCF